MKRLLILLAVASFVPSCLNMSAYNMEYELTNFVQTTEQGSFVRQDGILLYVYLGNEKEWGVRGWDDACNGVAVNATGLALEKIAYGTSHSTEIGIVIAPLAAQNVMILAVDVDSKMIAKRNMTIGLNEAEGSEMIVWRAWNRNDHTLTDWTFVSFTETNPYEEK